MSENQVINFGGRPKGARNRVTPGIRQALKELAENNIESVQSWLDRVAATDPAEALRLWTGLLRFVTPTLAASAVDLNDNRKAHQLSNVELQERVLMNPKAGALIASGEVSTMADLLFRLYDLPDSSAADMGARPRLTVDAEPVAPEDDPLAQ